MDAVKHSSTQQQWRHQRNKEYGMILKGCQRWIRRHKPSPLWWSNTTAMDWWHRFTRDVLFSLRDTFSRHPNSSHFIVSLTAKSNCPNAHWESEQSEKAQLESCFRLTSSPMTLGKCPHLKGMAFCKEKTRGTRLKQTYIMWVKQQ
jgi:hypothetical protein